MVKWRWQGEKNHRKMCEEVRHPGSLKIYEKTMFLLIGRTLHLLGREVSLLIGPDNTFIRKEIVLANRAGHYVY